MKLNHGIAVAIAAVPLTALPALAADYCITQTGIVSGTYVGKDFTPPKAGDCKDWQGFCKEGCSPDNIQAGIACTASSNSHTSYGITTFYMAGSRQFDWIRLDLPGQTGSGNLNYQDPSLGTKNYTAKGAPCSAGTIP